MIFNLFLCMKYLYSDEQCAAGLVHTFEVDLPESKKATLVVDRHPEMFLADILFSPVRTPIKSVHQSMNLSY